jgi:hypothetical protein
MFVLYHPRNENSSSLDRATDRSLRRSSRSNWSKRSGILLQNREDPTKPCASGRDKCTSAEFADGIEKIRVAAQAGQRAGNFD